MTCSVSCAIEYTNKKKQKDWKKRKAAKKKELMTLTDWVLLAQGVFNKYIRERDKGQPCISCKNPNPKKINAGHFWNANNHWIIRFDESIVHLQCEYCNNYLSGNENAYRINIVDKIGQAELDRLDSIRTQPANYTIDEIKNLIEIYKEKIRILKNNN